MLLFCFFVTQYIIMHVFHEIIRNPLYAYENTVVDCMAVNSCIFLFSNSFSNTLLSLITNVKSKAISKKLWDTINIITRNDSSQVITTQNVRQGRYEESKIKVNLMILLIDGLIFSLFCQIPVREKDRLIVKIRALKSNNFSFMHHNL